MTTAMNDILLSNTFSDTKSVVNGTLNYIKRFGNKDFSKSVYTTQAKKAVEVLKPETIDIITGSATDFFKKGKIKADTKPELTKPLTCSDERSNIANEKMRFIQIMASLSKLIADSKISSIQSNARDYNLRLKAAKQACDELASITTGLYSDLNSNIDFYFAALDRLREVVFDDLIVDDVVGWNECMDHVDHIRLSIEHLRQFPDSPQNNAKIKHLESDMEYYKDKASGFEKEFKKNIGKILKYNLYDLRTCEQLIEKTKSVFENGDRIFKQFMWADSDLDVGKALHEAEDCISYLNSFQKTFSSIDNSRSSDTIPSRTRWSTSWKIYDYFKTALIQAGHSMSYVAYLLNVFDVKLHELSEHLSVLLQKENEKHEDKLTYVMALIAKLIDESSRDELESAAKIREKLSEAAARDAAKKAKEFAAQERKAEHLQKTMGCIGKIIGAVITVVGVAAAAFTGGASLALAGVGLGLAVGDEICRAATGHSFIQDALQMVMKPLLDEMSKIFSHLLAVLGVNGSAQELISNILGAVAASVIFIAGMAVAGSAVGKLGGAILQKVGSKLAEQLAEAEVVAASERSVVQSACSTMNNVVKKVWGGIGRASGMDEEKLAQISTYSQMGMVASGTVNSGIQTGGDILVNNMRLNAAKINAKMQMDASVQNVLRTMMDNAIEAFRKQNIAVNSIIENMSSMAENLYQTDRYIVESMNSTFA